MSTDHPDWNGLTWQQKAVMSLLRDSYPRPVSAERLSTMRVKRTGSSSSSDEPLVGAKVRISHIRKVLGDDSVVSVYESKVNSDGKTVRGRMVGYRINPKYLTHDETVTIGRSELDALRSLAKLYLDSQRSGVKDD